MYNCICTKSAFDVLVKAAFVSRGELTYKIEG